MVKDDLIMRKMALDHTRFHFPEHGLARTIRRAGK